MEEKTGATFVKNYKMKDVLDLAKNPQLFDLQDEPDISCFCGDDV